MKLRELHFDDLVSVPGWTQVLGGANVGRNNVFHAEDGWELHEISKGVFRIQRDGMPRAVYVGGYGYSVVEADPEPETTPSDRPMQPEDLLPPAPTEPMTGKRRRK